MIDWKVTTYRLARAHGGYKALAEKLGVHRQTLAHLGTGHTRAPSFDTGIKILAAYSRDIAPIAGAIQLAERAQT